MELRREITPELTPWGTGSRSFKKGDDSWTVVALQGNLNFFGKRAKDGSLISNNLVLDGVFGDKTDAVVRSFQRHRKLYEDGIAGSKTQERIVLDLGEPAAKSANLATGLFRGLAQTESDFLLAAYTEHPSDSGFDLGPLQDSYTRPADSRTYLNNSLLIPAIATETSLKVKSVYNLYVARGNTYSRAWGLAGLYHNWPVAADRLSRGLSIFTDPARDNQPAQWVIDATGGRLSTPAQWVDNYISKVTRYTSFASASPKV